MDNITKSFSIALPIGIEQLLPDAVICPVRIVEQKSFTSKGNIEAKQQLTHDQLFCQKAHQSTIEWIFQICCMVGVYHESSTKLLHFAHIPTSKENFKHQR
jgi:hypothetical protein